MRILTTTLSVLLCLASLSLSAQLTRSAPSTDRAAPGVALSEIATFRNNEVVPYTILPYGNDFFLSTYIEQYGAQGLLGSGQMLDDLYSLKLYRYNEDLKQAGVVEIAWPNEQRDHLSLSSLGDRLLWTFATTTGKNGVYQIEAEVLDDKGVLVSNHPLLKIDRREFPYLKALEEYSADRQYYARVYAEESIQRFMSKRDEEPASLTIAVFDNYGEVISMKRKRLRCDRDQLEVQSVSVDNDGRAYVLAKVYANSQRRETGGGSDSKVYLYTLDPGAEELERVEMKLGGQYIEGISMVPGREGNPAIAGVYTDRRGGRIAGYFSTDNPRKGEILKPKPFSQELLQSLGSRITAKRRGQLVMEGDFEFRDAIRLTNGKLTILLESFDIRSNNMNNGVGVGGIGNVGGNQFTYIFGEGVMLTFNEVGEISEATVVPKYQSTDNPDAPFYSLNLVEYQGRPAAIYNDNPKNFTRDLSKRTKSLALSRALAIITYSDSSGELQRDPIFARMDADKLVLVPSSATRLANNDVVFMALRYKAFGKNQFRFGRLRQ
ncbi:MAG: hypothetical protein AB8F78_13145 [Saprospiraceae bacterium]